MLKCSYLEIYKEVIIDLLNPQAEDLHLREDTKKGVYVENLMEVSCEDLEEILKKGRLNKHIESTTMNQESSRSHTIFTLILETKQELTTKFHIVDLAGSERPKLTELGGERLKEAGRISKSLSSLGNVINSLAEISQGKVRHVAYRDSKLTFLLKNSLGGNSKTVIIANVSQNSLHAGETLSTLIFAKRVKMIKNKVLYNRSTELKSLLRNSIEVNDITIFTELMKERGEEVEMLKRCVRRCQNDKARDKIVLLLKEAALIKLQEGKLTVDEDRERLRKEVQALRDTEEEVFKSITDFISHSDAKEQLMKSNMEKSECIERLNKYIKELLDERDILNAHTIENDIKHNKSIVQEDEVKKTMLTYESLSNTELNIQSIQDNKVKEKLKVLEEENTQLKERVDKLEYELLESNNALNKYKEQDNIEEYIKQTQEFKDLKESETAYKVTIKKLEDKIQLFNEELGRVLMESKVANSKKESLVLDNESLKTEVINLKKLLKNNSSQLEHEVLLS
jgi:hypothetical protein